MIGALLVASFGAAVAIVALAALGALRLRYAAIARTATLPHWSFHVTPAWAVWIGLLVGATIVMIGGVGLLALVTAIGGSA